jgi:hypothetical protein
MTRSKFGEAAKVPKNLRPQWISFEGQDQPLTRFLDPSNLPLKVPFY